MIKTGVIGHPIGHSKSSLIHGYWIKKYGLEGSYEGIDIPCESLQEEIQKLTENDYAGFNVTIPHKEAVMDLCDEIDDTAKHIGAVNTIVIEDGKIKGTNTDAFGFIENIKQEVPSFDFTAGPAVVLGAGGAAKAVIYGLLQEGVPEIQIFNRTPEKAKELAQQYYPQITMGEWNIKDDGLEDAAFLVNTTSLGMQGQPELDIDLRTLPDNALVTDIVYAPLETELLKQAQGKGNKIVTGIGMLLHQARPAFESWYGVMPEIDQELQQKVLA